MDINDQRHEDTNSNADVASKLNLSSNTEISYNSLQLLNFIDDYFKSDTIKSFNCDERVANSDSKLKSKKRLAFFCYPCIACSSNYYYEQSLHLHLERRTAQIKVFCIKCNAFKTFFNRCKLIYHLYSHKNFLIEPLYKQLSIDLLPIEKLITTNKTKINLDAIDILGLTSDDLSNLENFQKKLKLKDFMLFKCLICDAVFFNSDDLKEHFQKGKSAFLTSTGQYDLKESDYMDKFTSESLIPFKEDGQEITRNIYLNNIENLIANNGINSDLDKFSMNKLKYASRCSLIANLNMIFNKFNIFSSDSSQIDSMMLICPECGLCFSRGKLENFRNHLISQCFYSIKNFRIKCMHKNCEFICKTKKLAIDHWSQKHIKVVKYCEICHRNGLKVNFIQESDNENINENEEDEDSEDNQQINKDEKTEKLIEKHFMEKHKEILLKNIDQFVKTIYECECTLPECTFETWKLCRKHYVQKLNKIINSITCFICEKNFNFIKYKHHLLSAHKIKNLTICDTCSYLTE